MKKIISVDEMIEILNDYVNHNMTYKHTINGNKFILDEYEMKLLNEEKSVELYSSNEKFLLPLEHIKEICSDRAMRKARFLLLTISYSAFEHICLHITL